jgi:flagellum-specific peptidoglycan hydrolase FlgJ
MPGTILLDDLRSSIGDELRSHAQGLLQLGQGAVQSINDAIPPPPPVPQGPDPNQILQELQQHAQQAAAAAQPAVQVLGGAQQSAGDVLQQLQQHASNLTSDVGQQLQQHVNSLTQGAQDAVQSLATPPPAPPPPATTTPSLGGPPPSDTGPATVGQGQSAFITSLQGMAQRAAAATGIDPNAMLAIAANETGWGQSSNAQQQNNLFSLQGDGSNGSRWASYKSPQESFDAFINLVQTAPRYAQAWADRGNAAKFVDDLRNAGYVVDEPGYPAQGWVDQVKSIYDHLPPAAQGAVNAVQGAGQQVLGAARGALDTASTAMNQSQFGDPQLTADEAYAACGPAAAVRFAERFGRNPTLREATDLAKQVGWTSGGGMAGITSEQRLLKNMGVDTHIVAPDWDAIAKEATTGNPVTISTPGHYFFADGYNPQTGAFHVGRSGLDLVHGSEWMTPAQMENLMGRAQGALFADNPAVPASSTSPTALGGTGGASNAPITIGGPAPLKAPLYVKGAMQDANGNVVADQGPTPIQSAADVLGGAAGAVGEAVGGAASALGSAAQGALAQATAPVQLQPGQVSARDQVNQVASDVQQAAQGVLGAAQDVNRMTPGTSAVNAVAPVLGAAASDLGTTARGAVDATVPVLGGAASDLGTQAEAFARSPVGQRLLQAAAENAQEGPSLIPAGTMSLYRDVMQVKNDWLEQNNPLNNLPGARPEPGHEGDITPGGLIAGLTTGIAQQFTDPLMLALLGPTSGVAEAGTGALSGAVSRIVGPQLAERLSPAAVSVLGTIAQKFSQGAIVGGLQNAMFEAEKKTSTPESVGQALVVGAGLGGVIDVGSVPVMAVVRRLGQVLLDNAPQISEALRSRQPAQAQVGAALGLPAGQDVLHGQAVPRPGYEPGTPEHTTETFLQDAARSQGTARPQISGADVAGLPGMAGTRSRGLQEVRDAVDAGLPAARWYQQIVQQVRQDTGQDINPREGAVLMGAFGGNAGVQANYHAMLSVFDAMRQAHPDLTGMENMTEAQVQATQAFKDVAALVHGDSSYADDSMLARVMRGYRTGEIPVPSGAKLSSYTQDFLHALNEQYSPYSTQDVWQGRLFGARPDVQGNKPLPNVSGNDAAYRTMHALTNWVARERNLPPDQAQAAAWTVFRSLYTDPTIGPELRNDRIGLSDAIKQGQQSGLLNPQSLATGGLAEVTAPRTGVATSWTDKINDVRDRIRQNGSYNAPPPESATAINEMALYHPSIQSAAEQRAVLDPGGFQYGTVAGPKVGVRRPVGNEPAARLRDLALGDQPVIRVPGELAVDPTTGKIPWLAVEHDVQQTASHAYVTVPGIGDDAAHLIGQRLGADRFNHADPNVTSAGGLAIEGLSREAQVRLADAFQAQGLPVIREVAGTGLRLPLIEGKLAGLGRQVQDTLSRESVSGTITPYTGASHAIKSAGQGRIGGTGNQGRGAAGSLGIPTRNGVRGQQLAQAVFRDAATAPGGGAATPARGGLRGSRERAQAPVPFGVNLAGGVAGGYAGNLATPQDASPEERLRNIGLGATAGLLGTHLITRGGVGPLMERAVAGVGREGEAGFRAPETRPTLEEQLARAADRGPRPGDNLLRATTEERPPPSEEPTRQTVRGVESGTPRNIGEVVTNPHLLDAAGPGETPMTMDERLAHQDTLEQRYQANQDRLAAIDEQLRNPTQKPERPPWGAGYTNDNLVEIAQQHNQSAYDPLWWEKAGLDTGSGEVRLDVGQSGIRGTGTREPTPTELRAERNTLALDQRHIEAAGEQQANAPDDAQFARRGQRAADLPFAGGEENAPHGPYATEQASSGAGSLAEDIVTQNGRKSYGDPLSGDGLREAPGEIVGTRGGVTGRGISDVEAANVPPPSEATLKRMPNLDAMLKGAMPEVRAQIQRAAEDNPELFDAYTQGRISHDSLVNDLATKVGMTREEWLKTPVGKGFNPQEMVALQAAAIDAQARSETMARDIVARGGVDALSDEQVAYGLNELSKNTQLLTVARGGRSTAGRTLESLKNRLDATMARGINASNERIGAQRIADQAKRATARATQLLEKTREMDVEQKTAVATARSNGAPKNILDQIAAAYDQLDRYNAMTLHEKADDFNALKAAREAAAAKRQVAVREPPQELLSALQAELAAERKNFANRKNTWENMAFWDSKANEIAAEKRNAFRGGLYIEQYRKSADLAAKSAEADAKRAFDLESKRQTLQSQRASSVLEAIGGAKPSRELLASYVKAITSDDPLDAGKFIKGLQQQGWWGRSQIVRIAGLLSSTVTHMANMVGNISQVPLEVATHGMVVGIDWARAAATGGERQAYMAELGPMLEAYGPGFASSMPDALKILQTGISPDDLLNPKNMRAGLQSGSAKLDAAVEMPLRLLQAEDQVFKGGAFAMQANRVATRYAVREGFRGEQLKGRTANIVKNFEEYPELYKEAHAAMLRMVFQEHRDWIPSPRGAAQGVVSQPLPFIKTPANITAQGGGLSPFGLAGTVAAVRARGALQSAGGATSAQLGRATLLAEQRLARTALGTAIVGMGVGMGAGTFSGGKSMLTGAYDPNEASTYPQGWREWSVVTQDPVSGNTYYVPLQNFGAAGAPLAMAAILTDAGKRGHSLLDKDEAARAATSIGQYVLDNTFLQGLSDTVNVLHDPSRYANKFLESLVSSYGPYSAMGRQIQRAYGVASRNPHDGFMGLVEAMESNYPGLSGNVPESLTAIGEPRTQGISGAAAFALPVRADILRDEPTLKALRDNDVRIPPAPKAVNVGNGWSVDLTPEEQDQLQRSRGEIIRQQVAAVMGSSLYKDGDISVRNQLLSKAISNASQNSDVLFTRTLSRADLQSTTAGGRAVRRTVPTPYTVAGEDAA